METLWDKAFSSIVSVCAAGVFVLVLNLIRTEFLKEELLKGISAPRPYQMWTRSFDKNHEDFISVEIQNHTSVSVVVRRVHLVDQKGGSWQLGYTGPGDELGWKMASNEKIPLFLMFSVSIDRCDTERDYKLLPAHTTGTWSMPTDHPKIPMPNFKECKVLIEYPTLFGARDIMVISANDDIVASINGILEQQRLFRTKNRNTDAI